MADQFGLLSLPASASDDPIGDPALAKVGSFLRAVINYELDEAWSATEPQPDFVGPPEQTPIVKEVLQFNPMQRGFNVEALPALFIWRSKGVQERLADDIYDDVSTWFAMWVSPALPQEEQRNRDPSWQSIAKAVGAALNEQRHPSWVDEGDVEQTAPSWDADPDSIMLAKPTETTPRTYSGVLVDGEIGNAEMAPRRELAITTTLVVDEGAGEGGGGGEPGSGEQYNTLVPLQMTFIDWSGDTRTRPIRLTLSMGGETIPLGEDVAQHVSTYSPGQLGERGTISIGTTARIGFGSWLLGRAGLDRCRLMNWDIIPLETSRSASGVHKHALDGDQSAVHRLPFYGLQMTLEVREFLTRDLSRYPEVNDANPYGAGVDIEIQTSDGTVIGNQSLPTLS